METKAKVIADITSHKTGCLIINVAKQAKLSGNAAIIDKACDGLLTKLIKLGDFKAAVGDSLLLPQPNGIAAQRLLIIGTGPSKTADKASNKKAITKAAELTASQNGKDATLCWESDVDSSEQAALFSQEMIRAQYRYTEKLSNPKPASALTKVFIAAAKGKESTAINKATSRAQATANGINTARLLGDLPGNICTPTYLANQAKALAKQHAKLSTKVLSEKQMADLGMGSLLSVSAGSDEPAQLIVMEYKGSTSKKAPIALVGKGITFDSGGISLKPGAGMDEMKYDMGGAASVFGTITAIAEMELNANVVAVVAASENMPNGQATKPGDVVTSMSGKTIEVLNTDAEGRLVLCDALSYVQRFKPRSIIDIATLTGACVIALGRHNSGLFSNDDELANQLLTAADSTGDKAWRLPISDDYTEMLKSNFADLANIGGREAGSITAACFLSQFVEGQKWAHIDIAGSAWCSGANKGATGRPVSLLTQYIIDQA
ncbi:leucyl aminopeptidase [Sinobacterium caligoides]|uniref:Probable cytosol aminopeptidase n=1 Tax=Sinobacterium caligoides TaxID=933926 RepID=A0A3N2E014_9GAMM|nr:leucyl aminopeptidase [Sinobacterium caligoides]ROS05252.1 leucyl aminopeptidase [Sinobacterium caligoides]